MTTRRITASICAVLVLAILVGLAFSLRRPSRPDFLLDPAKNAAYSNLLAATAQIFRDEPDTDLTELVTRKAEAFDAVRRTLTQDMEAPESSYDGRSFDPMRFVHSKKFAQALGAKARLASSQQRYAEAAAVYFDTLCLGEHLEHGPMINFLFGAVIERIAIKGLETLVLQLSTNDLADLAPKLQSFNHERISFEEIIRREHYYMVRNATNVIDAVRARFSRQTTAVVGRTSESHINLRAQLEIVAATMAAVHYGRQNNMVLTNLDALVPRHLKMIPFDPYANGPMRLLASTNGPVIYSVGKNGVDERAKGDDVTVNLQDTTASRIMFRAVSE